MEKLTNYSFFINGIEWRIYFVEWNDYRLYKMNGELSIAVCDNYDKAIYINKYIHGDFLYRVLCHEITHATIFSHNLVLALEEEELFADLMATYGNEIIQLVNYLRGR